MFLCVSECYEETSTARNPFVVGVVNAIACANMAIAGITSRIPADEVIDAMGDIGRHMPETLRETATGSLAVTPTAQKVVERFSKTKNNFYKKLF